MMYENDKLNIPESYRKMSVSELRREKEKLYSEIRKSPQSIQKRQPECKRRTIMFHF